MKTNRKQAERAAALKLRLMDMARGAGIDTDYVEPDGLDLVSAAGSKAMLQFYQAIRWGFTFTDIDGGDAQSVLAMQNIDQFENFDRLANFLVQYIVAPVGMATVKQAD